MNSSTIYIDITVKPRSSQRKITVDANGHINAFINSPPVDGKANIECIELCAETLGIAKSNIALHRGHRGRRKTLAITGMTEESVLRALRS